MKRSYQGGANDDDDDDDDDSSYEHPNDRQHEDDDEDDDDEDGSSRHRGSNQRGNSYGGAVGSSAGGADSTRMTDSTRAGVTGGTARVTAKSKSSQWEQRQERRRESNRLSKRRCRGQKRELISSFQKEVHRLTEEFNELAKEKELLQKELVECLLEQQQEQDERKQGTTTTTTTTKSMTASKPAVINKDERKLDAIGESLVQAAAAIASASPKDKKTYLQEDSKLPPSLQFSSLLAASQSTTTPAPAASIPKLDDIRTPFPSVLNANDRNAAFLSTFLGQQLQQPQPTEHHLGTGAVATIYTLLSAVKNNHHQDNNNTNDLRNAPIVPQDHSFAGALSKPTLPREVVTAAASAPPPPMDPLHQLRSMMHSTPFSLSSAALNPMYSLLPPATLTLPTNLQSNNNHNNNNNHCGWNSILPTQDLFMPHQPSPSIVAAAASLSAAANNNNSLVNDNSNNNNSHTLNLLLQQRQRHQKEQQELLLSLLSRNNNPSSDRTS